MIFNKLLGYTFLCLSIFFSVNSFSQESHTEPESNHEHEKTDHHKKHALSIAICHTYIRSGRENEEGNDWVAAPSFGINYNYSLSDKWMIGIHNDVIIEEVVINHFSLPHGSSNSSEPEKVFDRARPISSSLMVTYKVFKNIAFMAGGGMVFSKHEDFRVVRIGIETPFHLPNNWELFSELTYDFNIDSFDSITFGVGIAKLF